MRAAVSIRFSPLGLCTPGNGYLSPLSRARRRSFATSERRLAGYGFIGLGKMGHPMAKNLRDNISPDDILVIHDRSAEATTSFMDDVAGTNTKVAGTLREVAEQAETIITVLPEPRHVKNVFRHILDPPLPRIEPERLFIDCSTIDPASSREVANAVHSTKSGRFVDAPMSGGVVGAQNGTLTFMLGASSRSGQLVERVTPILHLMGKRVLHMGEQGTGLSGKLANNYLLALSNIATAEAMHLGIKWGLDPHKLGELINTSSGRCWSSEVNNPVPGISEGAPAAKDYDGGFDVALMSKDLSLAVLAAKEKGARLELGEKATDVYNSVMLAEAGKDFSVVYRWLGGKL